MQSNFIPEWKRNGFKSKEDAIKGVLKYLVKNRKKLVGKSLTGTAEFQIGGKTVIIDGKTKRVEESSEKA